MTWSWILARKGGWCKGFRYVCFDFILFNYFYQKTVVEKQEKRNQERLKRREEREKEERMRRRWVPMLKSRWHLQQCVFYCLTLGFYFIGQDQGAESTEGKEAPSSVCQFIRSSLLWVRFVQLMKYAVCCLCQVPFSWPQKETLTLFVTRQAPFPLTLQGEEETASQPIPLTQPRTPSQPRAELQTQVNTDENPH